MDSLLMRTWGPIDQMTPRDMCVCVKDKKEAVSKS